jgi:hypothetical protein
LCFLLGCYTIPPPNLFALRKNDANVGINPRKRSPAYPALPTSRAYLDGLGPFGLVASVNWVPTSLAAACSLGTWQAAIRLLYLHLHGVQLRQPSELYHRCLVRNLEVKRGGRGHTKDW